MRHKLIKNFDLIQEHYSDPWAKMICCMLLNQTTREQVDKVVDEFFDKWPDPETCSYANPLEIAEVLKSLGFKNKRSEAIIKMSHEWISKDWKEVKELHGLGKYAQDCYDMLVKGIYIENPSDHALKNYSLWMKENK